MAEHSLYSPEPVAFRFLRWGECHYIPFWNRDFVFSRADYLIFGVSEFLGRKFTYFLIPDVALFVKQHNRLFKIDACRLGLERGIAHEHHVILRDSFERFT